ncbi:unnamed protein product [Caenorhabditis brenneri]
MSPLVTCTPELLLQFQRDYHPDLRRRYMYTFFTHVKIPLGVIKRIIKTPTRMLEIRMIMWHLCNCEFFFSFNSRCRFYGWERLEGMVKQTKEGFITSKLGPISEPCS